MRSNKQTTKKYRLKTYELASDIFDTILYQQQYHIKRVEDINEGIYGYKNKNTIYYDGYEWLICKEMVLNYYCGDILEDYTDWKQVRVRRVENTDVILRKTTNGQFAWEFMLNVLMHHYTWDEIVDCLHKCESEFNPSYSQYHYMCPVKTNSLIVFHNCYKYDINGAHCDALAEIFPKAKNSILSLYDTRKINPLNKDYINFFVGMLCKKGFRKTYNWIVQRTTKILYKAMDYTKGLTIYANTDGYVISDPFNKLETTKELGNFKLEYSGDVFVYQAKNYWLMQCGNELKGSCLRSVRKNIDLSKGQVVNYDRKRILIKDNLYINIAENQNIQIKEIING